MFERCFGHKGTRRQPAARKRTRPRWQLQVEMLEGRIVPAGDPTTTVLSTSAAAVDAGANLTLTALVTDTAASPSNPAGTVSFFDGQATLTGVKTTTSIGTN